MLARPGEVPLPAGEQPQLVLDPPQTEPVAARLHEPPGAGVPRQRPPPLGPLEGDPPQPDAGVDRARLIELGLRQDERTLIVPGPLGVPAMGEADAPQRQQRLDLRPPVLESFGDRQRHLIPGAGLLQPPHALFQPARAQQGGHRGGGLPALLRFQRGYVRAVQRADVLRDEAEHGRHPARQLPRLDGVLAHREIRPAAAPLQALVGAGAREQQAAERHERLEVGQQAQRLLDLHRPYSFILRVSVLRWIPRISAAAPI